VTSLERAWAKFEADDFDAATLEFRAVLDAATSDDERRGAQYGLGYALAFSNAFDEARGLFETLHTDAVTRGDDGAAHRALHQVGMVQRMAGDWLAARDTFAHEAELIHALGDDPLAVSVNAYEQGWVALHLGEMASAKTWLDRALENASRTDDQIAVACAWRGLGDWYAKNARVDEALHAWNSSRAAFLRVGDARGATEIEACIRVLR
jgi:tetratricopeptide (TPR) repeat protein